MSLQMIVLIILSVMLVAKIVYLAFFVRPEHDNQEDHHAHGHHHNSKR